MSQAATMLRDPEAIEEMLEEIIAEREQWQDRKAAQTVTVPAGWTEEAAWYRYYDQRLCQQMYLSATERIPSVWWKKPGFCHLSGRERCGHQHRTWYVFPWMERMGWRIRNRSRETWLCPSGTCEAKMRLRHPLGEIPAPGCI